MANAIRKTILSDDCRRSLGALVARYGWTLLVGEFDVSVDVARLARDGGDVTLRTARKLEAGVARLAARLTTELTGGVQ
jgi:hypothetical protein